MLQIYLKISIFFCGENKSVLMLMLINFRTNHQLRNWDQNRNSWVRVAYTFLYQQNFKFQQNCPPFRRFPVWVDTITAGGNTSFVLLWPWFYCLTTKIFSASDVSQLDDLDELEVYLNTESNPQSGSEITSCSFEVNNG